MQRNPNLDPLLNDLRRRAGKPAGLLQKIGGTAVALLVFGLALAFSVVFFAVIAAIALFAGIYFWWRTRDLRQVMRQAQAQAQAQAERRASGAGRANTAGMIIEGEVLREVREDDRRD